MKKRPKQVDSMKTSNRTEGRKVQSPLDAVRRLTDEWTHKSRAGMSRWLADDIVEIGPAFDSALAGKRMFFSKYQDYLNGPLEILSYKILQPRTIRLSSSQAMVYFRYRMRTRTAASIVDSHGKESMLCQQSRGAWRVRFIHWHQDP